MMTEAPKFIFSRDGKQKGRVVGKGKPCTLEGCRGWRYPVRWPDGKLTWPCSKGLVDGPVPDSLKIG